MNKYLFYKILRENNNKNNMIHSNDNIKNYK